MDEIVKIKFYYFSGWVGAETQEILEYHRAAWEAMTDDQKCTEWTRTGETDA